MFLKSGRISKKLYPGAGGEHIETISLGENVNKIYAVMNGFEVEFNGDDNHVQNLAVNLGVVHVSGTDEAELHCRFKLNDDNTSGDAFYAMCDYLLIGRRSD